mmetsp:Transcript_59649/g.193174  ORF Transcript_59649/g.193174 Transcript_59649/m.193174 type:complete len:255 (-) Transcript_59649:279-1043(-)
MSRSAGVWGSLHRSISTPACAMRAAMFAEVGRKLCLLSGQTAPKGTGCHPKGLPAGALDGRCVLVRPCWGVQDLNTSEVSESSLALVSSVASVSKLLRILAFVPLARLSALLDFTFWTFFSGTSKNTVPLVLGANGGSSCRSNLDGNPEASTSPSSVPPAGSGTLAKAQTSDIVIVPLSSMSKAENAISRCTSSSDICNVRRRSEQNSSQRNRSGISWSCWKLVSQSSPYLPRNADLNLTRILCTGSWTNASKS